MLEVEFAQVSDPGRVRGHNEDFIGYALPETPERVRSHGFLFALADGVGGQDLGEVASRTAVESILEDFRKSRPGDTHRSLLARLAQSANTRVYEAGRAAGPGGVPMATTLVACTLRFDRITVAHVGDSRCYLVRRGHAHMLTRDHTVVNDQVRLGVISAGDALSSENRHVLNRSLGNDLFVKPDVSEHHIFVGDVILLCSDGLHGALPAEEIAQLAAAAGDLEVAAERLVELANERDGSDNVSVQLIRVRATERVGLYRGRPYKLR
jgi:PPM family protein phosphatase